MWIKKKKKRRERELAFRIGSDDDECSIAHSILCALVEEKVKFFFTYPLLFVERHQNCISDKSYVERERG